MPEPTESTSLLRAALESDIEDASTESVVEDSLEDDLEEDHAMDLVMTRFGSPSDNVGLGGGSAVFSSSLLSHRAPLVFSDPPSSRASSLSGSLRHRPRGSLGSDATLRESRRRPSSRASLPKKPATIDGHLGPSRIEEESEAIEDEVQIQEEVKYMYGVSVARFWAVFVTIVLVWFVAAFDGIK